MQDKPVRPIVSGGSPRRARIPLHRAQRWKAEGENARAPSLQVFVTQTAFKAINNHANSDLDNEVGGWLAGRWCKDIDTKVEYVVVEALLPAQQVRSGSTFLTFTHDSQVAMLAALEERYAKKGIVGWYHTHPRMGLFLSGYDTWLHDHFFPHPWQVALVVEPHSHTGGFFIRNGKQELDTRLYFGFYELHNRRHESIVDWKNLQLEKKPDEVNGETTSGQPTKVGMKAHGKEASVPAGRPVVKKTVQVPKAEVQTSEEKPAIAVEQKLKEPAKELPARVGSAKKEESAVRNEKPAINVSIKKTEIRQPVLRKFEGPKPPARVNLQKNDEQKSDTQPETKPSEEAKS
jgi:proteasome lid subunit RPN8/RPN11